MTTFAAGIFDGIEEIPQKIWVTDSVTSITNAIIEPEIQDATISKTSHPDTSENVSASIPTLSFFDQVALDRVYVDPVNFDEGFITEEVDREIVIWNSGSPSRTISNIQETNVTGTSLAHGSVPITLLPETSQVHVLTVKKTGPPFQNAVYTYTIGGITYEITVTGRRVEAFPYEPDWRDGYRLSIGFKTIVSQSVRWVEQRRGMWKNARRKMQASFWFDDIDMQKFHNDLKTYNDKVLAIPVYHEYLTIQNDPIKDETVLDFTENLSKLLNLKEMTTFLILIDADNMDVSEVKEIGSIDTANKKITVKEGVSKSFTPGKTDVYPVLLGIIDKDSFEHEYITGELSKKQVKFSEISVSEI